MGEKNMQRLIERLVALMGVSWKMDSALDSFILFPPLICYNSIFNIIEGEHYFYVSRSKQQVTR
jgi:hypothetical protein